MVAGLYVVSPVPESIPVVAFILKFDPTLIPPSALAVAFGKLYASPHSKVPGVTAPTFKICPLVPTPGGKTLSPIVVVPSSLFTLNFT